MPEKITGAEWLDGARSPGAPDPHGEAALMLVESLIHALVARGDLSVGEALDVLEIATDAQTEISDARGETAERSHAVRYLSAIAASLRIDGPQEPGADGRMDGRVPERSAPTQPSDGHG